MVCYNAHVSSHIFKLCQKIMGGATLFRGIIRTVVGLLKTDSR